MKLNDSHPTNAELEILQILWELGEAKVKDVFTQLEKSKNVGYTTVLKTMQIMHTKNLVTRRAEGKGHIYTSAVNKEIIQERFLDKMINKVFNGSKTKLAMSLLGNVSTSQKELDEIKDFIRQQENKEE